MGGTNSKESEGGYSLLTCAARRQLAASISAHGHLLVCLHLVELALVQHFEVLLQLVHRGKIVAAHFAAQRRRLGQFLSPGRLPRRLPPGPHSRGGIGECRRVTIYVHTLNPAVAPQHTPGRAIRYTECAHSEEREIPSSHLHGDRIGVGTWMHGYYNGTVHVWQCVGMHVKCAAMWLGFATQPAADSPKSSLPT